MENKTKKVITIIVFVVLIVAIPFILHLLITAPNITKYINDTLKIRNGDAVGIIINYASFSATVILGIVVYFQAQRINKLESTNYDFYMGVVDVDYNYETGSKLVIDHSPSEFHLAHYWTNKQKTIFSSICIGKGANGSQLSIPLRFITKNKPLITTVCFESVNVTLKENDKVVFNDSFSSNDYTLYSPLEDGTSFVMNFGLVHSSKRLFDEIALSFHVTTTDQNRNITKMVITAVLIWNNNEKKYSLAYSLSSTR